MRLSVIIPALIIIACGGLAGYVWMGMPVEAAKAPPTGMDILRRYKCRKGETKTIVVRGIEDNHSPAGNEPNFIRQERSHPDVQSYFAGGSYDQVQADKRMTDSFQAPVTTARGLFLIRLKPVAGNETDIVGVGDLSTMALEKGQGGRQSVGMATLQQTPGWQSEGELHFAEFSAIRLTRLGTDERIVKDRTLLDYIRSGASNGWVDFMVQDDTSVDFAGAAFCLEPTDRKGVTMGGLVGEAIPMDGVVAISCIHVGKNQQMCDPYVGDTSCSASLPVACIHPEGAPVPRAISRHFVSRAWSGGRLAFTEPVTGSSFASYRDVDALCTRRFGSGWRSARWHDGPANLAIAGYSAAPMPTGRVWIDVVGSPYGTCWAR